MNTDTENHNENFSTCLIYQQIQPREKIIHHKIQAKQWEIVGAVMFTLHNKKYLCMVDYHSKFPVIKKAEDLPADSLIMTCKSFFSEYRSPKKIMSHAGDNFISDKFKTFCRNLNTEQAVLSSYHHQSNGQVRGMYQIYQADTQKYALTINLTCI